MDPQTARTLSALTTDFYLRCAASFSETRQAPWPGWRRVLDETADVWAPRPSTRPQGQGRIRVDDAADADADASAGKAGKGRPGNATDADAAAAVDGAGEEPPYVLDLGCGNLRFERFLAAEGKPFRAHAVDNCAALATPPACEANGLPHRPEGARRSVRFHRLDVAEELSSGRPLAPALSAAGVPPCRLAAAFGFMHHVPGFDARARALEALVEACEPGGYVAVSFWRFLSSERLAAKALATTRRAQERLGPLALDEHDYLLGWQHDDEALRYCHHFDEDEVDALAAAVAPRARETARFSADGASGDLNRYLILRVV